jgi:hypothetical protein
MAVPTAVFIPYFFANVTILSVPANNARALSASSEPGGKASAISSGNASVLSQMRRPDRERW